VVQILSQEVSGKKGSADVQTPQLNATNIITHGPSEVANFDIQSEEEEEDDYDVEYPQEDLKRGYVKVPRKATKAKRKSISPGFNGIRFNTKEGRLVMKQQAAHLPQALRELSKKRSRSPLPITSVGTPNPNTTPRNRLPIHLRTELELQRKELKLRNIKQ